MEKRTNSEELFSIALLYLYQYTNGMKLILSKESLDKFEQQVNINLDNMKSNYKYNGFDIGGELIYLYSTDEKGNEYYILKSQIDFEKAYSNYIGLTALDLLVATEMENALDYIGLIKNEKTIIAKENVKSKQKTINRCK